ncbi:FAD/NAD(P)-binding protein [Glarea lozoyensis ATCC 20868]|uniref:FAD/NAD(P)-binding protein n=1 Tax=Glarea lozoyensis (strain ATCC 20868 / MF5171) TaxID=1116229 RepID=S3E4W1_GLAL2|nr:FAD/NAD(P)-binding protein [Glarea lozoyensis ATCC 20868]EPE33453.1 FAD/NAD(P)-binding protein [Glarea lozoyensis ATCC 20868]
MKQQLSLPAILSFLFLATSALENPQKADTYDYIVVGSGPGGGTLAANLAKAGESVLLLEAGDDQGENLNEKISGWFSLAGNDPLMRWDFFVKYHSDPVLQRKYNHLTWEVPGGGYYVGTDPPAGSKELGIYYPRTGTLGGCGTHNAQCAPLPSDRDWDDIAKMTGDDSWSAANMREQFIKLENYHNPSVPKGTRGHGFDGWLDITTNGPELLRNSTEAQTVLSAAAKVFGQDPDKLYDLITRDLNNNDTNRDYQEGLFGFPAHRNPMGRRVSSRDVVIDTLNAKKYPLTLGLHSFVTKVLFDTKSKKPRATGVEYLAGMSHYKADPRFNLTASNAAAATGTKQAYARKEVIVSGGAFNSPQLLMLSGIGPKEHLESLNITVLVDSPGVGSNLQDNTEYGVAAGASQPFTSKGPVCTYGSTPDDPCLEAWHRGEGPYTQGPLSALMLKSSASVNGERDIYFFGIAGGTFEGYWPGQTVNQVPAHGPNTFDFSIVKMNPQGKKGTLRLVSNDPRDMPDINFRFFEEGGEVDLQALVDGVEFGRKVFDSIAAPLGPFKEILPCASGKRDCDVKEEIRAQTWSHHATSTCAIGADDDPMAVLDSKFRVRGTEGLRVVDASVFPKTPGAFPVIPTFMLGTKAGDVILEDRKKW